MSESAPQLLFIDDDAHLLESFSDFFSPKGFKIDTATDGLEALKSINKTAYDVIITDISMPRLNGLDLVANIKNTELNRNTPIFILSGNIDATAVKRIAKLGILEVLSKPVTGSILLEKIDDACKRFPRSSQKTYNPVLCTKLEEGIKSFLKLFFQEEVKVGACRKKATLHSEYVYSATTPIFGSVVYGSVTTTCDEVFITQLAQNTLGQRFIDAGQKKDLLREFSNQLCASFRTALESLNLTITTGVPQILAGADHPVPYAVYGPILHMLLDVTGALGIEICFGDPKLLMLDKTKEVPFKVFKD